VDRPLCFRHVCLKNRRKCPSLTSCQFSYSLDSHFRRSSHPAAAARLQSARCVKERCAVSAIRSLPTKLSSLLLNRAVAKRERQRPRCSGLSEHSIAAQSRRRKLRNTARSPIEIGFPPRQQAPERKKQFTVASAHSVDGWFGQVHSPIPQHMFGFHNMPS